MNLEDTTNLVDGDDTAIGPGTDEAGVGSGQDAGSQQLEGEEEGDDVAGAEPESVDIEHDGQTFKVPAALKEAFLRQADYTRKTQEVADARRAVIAERQGIHQTSEQELNAYAQATSLAERIAQYQKVDWARWHQDDPFAAAQATSEYQVLKDQHQQALGQLSHLRNTRISNEQQATARRIEEGRAVLTREVPGWDDTHKAKLIDFAAGYGFDRSELSDLEADPRVAKVLHAAFRGAELIRKAEKANKHVKDQQAQPAARATTAGAAPVKGLDDRLSHDEWLKRRNAQVQGKK